MTDTQTLDGGSNGKVDVSWKLQKSKTIPSGNTIWRLKICVKNKTGKKIKIAIAENPWRAPDNTEKMQYDKKDGQEVPGSDRKYAREGAKKLELEDGKEECVEFDYDVQPGMAYTDIYLVNDDGSLKDDWTWGTVEKLTPVQVSSAPPKNEPNPRDRCADAFQMALDTFVDGDAWLVADEINVPEGFELAASYPGIGAPALVSHSDRGSSMAVILRQTAVIPEGTKSSLVIWQRVARPAAMSQWPRRPVVVPLVRDTTPPEIELKSIRFRRSHVEISAEVSDACSGVGDVELQLLNSEPKHWCVVLPTSIRSLGQWSKGDKALVHFEIDKQEFDRSAGASIRATDLVGNEALLALPAIETDQ
jgi:hypothetical protein